MKSTVEWLGIELNMLFTNITEEQWNRANELFEQAKELEEKQKQYYFQQGKNSVTSIS